MRPSSAIMNKSIKGNMDAVMTEGAGIDEEDNERREQMEFE